MTTQHYNVLGVMSGTSLDGIDLVHVKLYKGHRWKFKVLANQCVEYNEEWKTRLMKGILLDNNQLERLNHQYTQFLAQVCSEFIKNNNITNLLAICSHGHTISHEPHRGHTLQIGNLPDLARLTQQRVVCDFRVQDVQLGGNGAPLVPIGDQLLFSQYSRCINLGGFANVSFSQDGERIAYDICAVNTVLNHYSRLLGKEYDDNGAFAKAGTPQTSIIHKLSQLEYYSQAAPKSLGIEWVNHHIFPLLESIEDPMDAIATYTLHAATTIAQILPPDGTVLLTGGGSYNATLVKWIQERTTCKIIIPDPQIIDYKEALIFALLGVLRLRNEVNCLQSVTGATRDHSSGKIYVP